MSLSVAVKVLEISDSATIAVCVVSSTVLTHKVVAVTVVGLLLRLRRRDLPLTAAVMLFLSMLLGLHIVWLGTEMSGIALYWLWFGSFG